MLHVLLAVLSTPAAPAATQLCPSAEELGRSCHNAKKVSVGDCVLCISSHFPQRCPDVAVDDFCSDRPDSGSSGSSSLGFDLNGELSRLAGVLDAAAPGDMLVRGPDTWQTPSHRTIINAVDQFQVDPTGAQNSTDRMQLAIDAAAALPNGGSVYLPAGNYQFENLRVASNVDIFGDSRSRSFCHTPGSVRPMFIVQNSMNVRIRDLWLVGGGGPAGPQSAVQTAGALLYANNAQKCQFTNLQLTNMFIGIEVSASTNCEISFVNAYNVYGPAVVKITGVETAGPGTGNGGGCYVFKNQLDMAPYGWPAPGIGAGYQPWSPGAAYSRGQVRSANGCFFLCVAAGTSARGGTGPKIAPFANADGSPHQIIDGEGSLRWAFLCTTTMAKISISQANSNMVFANDL